MKTISSLLGATLLCASFQLHASPPDWSIKIGRQNAMVVYASVTDSSGTLMTNEDSLLCASEYGMLVGSTPISLGPKGPLFQMKVGSDNWQSDLTFNFYDGKTDQVLIIGPGPGFVAGSTVGSITDPIVLTVKR